MESVDLHVALVSFEYPPETAFGGISTYAHGMANALVDAGLHVEVFCGAGASVTQPKPRLRVHRVPADRSGFSAAVASAVAQAHALEPFDVMEGPDFLGEALAAKLALPQLPYCVALHTPLTLCKALNQTSSQRWMGKARAGWFFLRNGRYPASGADQLKADTERQNLLAADIVHAPTQTICRWVEKEWNIDPRKCRVAPFPFDPPEWLLRLPIGGHFERVTFFGRLEVRKGLLVLARALPFLLRRRPEVRVRFIGADQPVRGSGLTMKGSLLKAAGPFADRLEFFDQVPREELNAHLAVSDVCVFPSLWESLGYVVLEAMAAGRAVVCSDNAGMMELIENGRYGVPVKPGRARALGCALADLLEDQSRREDLARRARNERLRDFTPELAAGHKIAIYQEAIKACARRVPG